MKTVTLLVSSIVASHAFAQETGNSGEPASDLLDEVIAYGRAKVMIGESMAASEGLVGYDDIRLPPLLRVGELVEAVPGMVATQHSGTGKANQYFIRGFNLDHGTDLAVTVDGVPVNLRTHGHGQGYLDLNFLIPELVETTTYRRGPYAGSIGDFGSAASVDFRNRDRLPHPVFAASIGEFGYRRVFAGGTGDATAGSVTAAFDATIYDGPWELPENLQQYKFHLGWVADFDGGRARVVAAGYSSEWQATDQVPRRAVESGQISELGYIDPDLGGDTARYALTGVLEFDDWEASAYAINYDFRLFSNFTYGLEDPLRGDEFEQVDDRRVFGARLSGERAVATLGEDVKWSWGLETRLDDIAEVGLHRTDSRTRTGTVRRDAVKQLSVGAWSEIVVPINRRLRAVAALRTDWYDWDVDALRTANSGAGSDSLVSPGASLAYRFGEGIEAYLNWGRGFHSNDVRGTTIAIDPTTGNPADPVDALVASEGAEVGLRMERGTAFNLTLVGFQLELDSELVFVGDAGTTEANDGTLREGIEASAFWQASDWLALNASYTTTNARFKRGQDGGRRIPGAVEKTFAFGLNAAWDSGFFASARLRWLGPAPLTEDNSVRADESVLVNAGLGYRRGAAEYRLEVFNLLDSDDADIAYYYASRLPGEAANGVNDVHYHPLEPRSVRASISLRWQ